MYVLECGLLAQEHLAYAESPTRHSLRESYQLIWINGLKNFFLRVSTIIIAIFQAVVYLPLHRLPSLLTCLLAYHPGKSLLIFEDSGRSSNFPGNYSQIISH